MCHLLHLAVHSYEGSKKLRWRYIVCCGLALIFVALANERPWVTGFLVVGVFLNCGKQQNTACRMPCRSPGVGALCWGLFAFLALGVMVLASIT